MGITGIEGVLAAAAGEAGGTASCCGGAHMECHSSNCSGGVPTVAKRGGTGKNGREGALPAGFLLTALLVVSTSLPTTTTVSASVVASGSVAVRGSAA